MTELGKWVSDWRVKKTYTQCELSRILKFTPQYVSNVERGANPRPVAFVLKLMPFLTPREQNDIHELLVEAIQECASQKIQRVKEA